MPRPEFRQGDVVMICCHLFDRARRGHDLPWKGLKFQGRFDPLKEFRRLDGTGGTCSFAVACGSCAKLPTADVDYVEEVYRAGQLHVADFMARRKAAV